MNLKGGMMIEPPEGIVITISKAMLKERSYRAWLKDFMRAMSSDEISYWMRTGTQPKHVSALQYVYLCIGNTIRFRANYVMSHGAGQVKFDSGTEMFANAWIVMAGPVVRPVVKIPYKGFRGFRYTPKLF